MGILTFETFFGGKRKIRWNKKVCRQRPDPEGIPSKLGPAARQRLKTLRIPFEMKEILKDLGLAWPAGRARQNQLITSQSRWTFFAAGGKKPYHCP